MTRDCREFFGQLILRKIRTCSRAGRLMRDGVIVYALFMVSHAQIPRWKT